MICSSEVKVQGLNVQVNWNVRLMFWFMHAEVKLRSFWYLLWTHNTAVQSLPSLSPSKTCCFKTCRSIFYHRPTSSDTLSLCNVRTCHHGAFQQKQLTIVAVAAECYKILSQKKRCCGSWVCSWCIRFPGHPTFTTISVKSCWNEQQCWCLCQLTALLMHSLFCVDWLSLVKFAFTVSALTSVEALNICLFSSSAQLTNWGAFYRSCVICSHRLMRMSRSAWGKQRTTLHHICAAKPSWTTPKLNHRARSKDNTKSEQPLHTIAQTARR